MNASEYVATTVACDLYTYAEVDFPFWRRLQAQGVDLDVVANLNGPVVRRSVSFEEGGYFVFDELGDQAVCLVAHGQDAVTPVDIVGFSIADPGTFGTLFGRAAVLGLDRALNPASFIPEPCPLWKTPLRWLQAQTVGAVVLRSIPASIALALAPGQFIAEDLAHARDLVKSGALSRDRVVVPRARAAA